VLIYYCLSSVQSSRPHFCAITFRSEDAVV
jgi:hypothetical protein